MTRIGGDTFDERRRHSTAKFSVKGDDQCAKKEARGMRSPSLPGFVVNFAW